MKPGADCLSLVLALFHPLRIGTAGTVGKQHVRLGHAHAAGFNGADVGRFSGFCNFLVGMGDHIFPHKIRHMTFIAFFPKWTVFESMISVIIDLPKNLHAPGFAGRCIAAALRIPKTIRINAAHIALEQGSAMF